MTDMKRYLVSAQEAAEYTDFIVDALNPRAAAMLYLEATLSDDAIACDPEDIIPVGVVQCHQLPDLIGQNLVHPWQNIERTFFDIDKLIPDYEARAKGEANPAPGS